MSRDAEGVGRCKGCGDSRPLTEAGYCNDDCAPCGCMESVALRAEVERLRVELGRIAYYFSRPTPDEAFVQDIARSALSPKVPE